MTDPPLLTAERALARAAELETDDAVTVLRAARDDVRTLEGDPNVDASRRQELETRLDQRLREVTERDAYDSGLGAAMNPAEDDAP